MRPSGVTALLNDIVLNQRKTVVECGGGVSSLYIATLLADIGGHLWIVRENTMNRWKVFIEESLQRKGIARSVTVILAPLKPTSLALDASHWYDTDILHKNLSGIQIDLLSVDGPPAWQERLRLARYPAIPFFRKFLADDYTFVLDDIDQI